MPIPAPNHASQKYSGELIQVWNWEQELFDGTSHTFECVIRPDAVTVIPFLNRDTVLLTKQEQPGKEPFMDFPGGRIDPGEFAEQAAMRELEEETGYSAATIFEWQHKKHAGIVRFEETLFLAQLGSRGEMHQDPGEKIEVIKLPWKEVVQLCLDQRLRNISAMMLVLQVTFNPATAERFEAFRKQLPLA